MAFVLAALRQSLALSLVLAFSGCRGHAPGESEAEISGKLCASACASLSTGCTDTESVGSRQARCLALCDSVRKDAESARCKEPQDQALACLSTAKIACKEVASTRSALSRGIGVAGCQPAFERLSRCSAPCREAGVTRMANRTLPFQGGTLEVKAEQISLGCGPGEPDLRPQSPPGAACEHHSVCTRIRCPCPGQAASYVARACVDGRCASGELACALVPSAVGYDACQAR